jgi:hypothetical protein
LAKRCLLVSGRLGFFYGGLGLLLILLSVQANLIEAAPSLRTLSSLPSLPVCLACLLAAESSVTVSAAAPRSPSARATGRGVRICR